MPYGKSTKEEPIFSSPGYRLGTHPASIEELDQTKVYFHFDRDPKKHALRKVFLKKKPSNESVLPIRLKRDGVANYIVSNHSRHHDKCDLPYNISIKESGNKFNISSYKEILKKYKGLKIKLIQHKRNRKNVVFEKSNNFKNTVCFYFFQSNIELYANHLFIFYFLLNIISTFILFYNIINVQYYIQDQWLSQYFSI